MKEEKIHILAAFGDIRGSGIYRQRVADKEDHSMRFWHKFDSILECFECRHDYFLNHLGDGFLCVAKLGRTHGSRAIKFLNEMFWIKKEIDGLIQSVYPRPDGFRVHAAAGPVLQKMQSNGKLVFHGYHIDLIGTTIGTEALDEIPFVAHESVRDLMTPREISMGEFQFDPLTPPRVRRKKETLYKTDMAKLYALSK